eukprot:UN2769
MDYDVADSDVVDPFTKRSESIDLHVNGSSLDSDVVDPYTKRSELIVAHVKGSDLDFDVVDPYIRRLLAFDLPSGAPT